MVRGLLLLALALIACHRGAPASLDAGLAPAAPVETVAATWALTPERLEAWLRWQGQMAALPGLAKADGGARREALTRRARLEAGLLADAGLSAPEVDRIEEVISAVVAERTVERLSGGAALEQFKAALAELSPEQRARAEAAYTEASAKGAPSARPALEAKFGADAVGVVLGREAEVTKAWDALLEAR